MFSAVAGLEIIGLAKSRLSPSGQIDGPASLCNGNQDANRKCKTDIVCLKMDIANVNDHLKSGVCRKKTLPKALRTQVLTALTSNYS